MQGLIAQTHTEPACIHSRPRGKTRQIVTRALESEHCTIDLQDVDEEWIYILLLVEDPNFFVHKGIDMKTPGAGLTTISQGLVKYFYFKDFRPGIAKIRQSFIARFRFHPKVSKSEQLTLFFNYAYLGNDDEGVELRGFEMASGYYYVKPFNRLTREEYVALVAMLINPNQYRFDRFPERHAERMRRIGRLLAGECTPDGWRDCDLEGCE